MTSKLTPKTWQTLRDIFDIVAQDNEITTYRELMKHDMTEEATSYMYRVCKDIPPPIKKNRLTE